MKVGTDGVFLGAWVSLSGKERTILDAGTGTGVIALMMAQRSSVASVFAIDIDPASIEEAAENFIASPWPERLSAKLCDFREWDSPVDLIVCNPPFFTNALKAPQERRTLARHNDTLTHSDLVEGALRCLTADGRLAVVLPCDEASSLLKLAAGAGLFPARICNLRTSPGKAPKRTLLELSAKKTPPAVPEEIVIESEEYKSLTRDFYLKY